ILMRQVQQILNCLITNLSISSAETVETEGAAGRDLIFTDVVADLKRVRAGKRDRHRNGIKLVKGREQIGESPAPSARPWAVGPAGLPFDLLIRVRKKLRRKF